MAPPATSPPSAWLSANVPRSTVVADPPSVITAPPLAAVVGAVAALPVKVDRDTDRRPPATFATAPPAANSGPVPTARLLAIATRVRVRFRPVLRMPPPRLPGNPNGVLATSRPSNSSMRSVGDRRGERAFLVVFSNHDRPAARRHGRVPPRETPPGYGQRGGAPRRSIPGDRTERTQGAIPDVPTRR